jgi:hypothetical protein
LYSTGSKALIRQLNRAAVLNLTKREGPISRVEIARRLALSGAAVTSIAGELEALGGEAGEIGTYLVSYRVISQDSHPIGGSITYSVGAPSETPELPEAKGAARRKLLPLFCVAKKRAALPYGRLAKSTAGELWGWGMPAASTLMCGRLKGSGTRGRKLAEWRGRC